MDADANQDSTTVNEEYDEDAESTDSTAAAKEPLISQEVHEFDEVTYYEYDEDGEPIFYKKDTDDVGDDDDDDDEDTISHHSSPLVEEAIDFENEDITREEEAHENADDDGQW